MNLAGTKDVYWKSGELNLDTNTFIVGRNVIASGDGPSALGTRVAETAGLLAVTNNLTGIANLDLNVAVSAKNSEVKDKTYRIVTNKANLGGPFKSVHWAPAWSGEVDYSKNGGREIWLYELERKDGTLFMLR